MLHDFEPNSSDFQLIVKAMVHYVTENHRDFVTKKADEIAQEYLADMDKRVENLWTLGLKEASVSPIKLDKFVEEKYLGEVAEEYFTVESHPLVDHDNFEFVEKMFNPEAVDSNNMSSFYYKNQANATQNLFLQLDAVRGSNELLWKLTKNWQII